MSGLLVRALRAALPGPAAVRRLRTAAPRPAYAKELFLGELRKVSAARPGHRLTANGALRRAGLGPLGAAGREGSRPYLAVVPRAGRCRVAPRAPRGFRAERPSICARVAPRVPGPLPGCAGGAVGRAVACRTCVGSLGAEGGPGAVRLWAV